MGKVFINELKPLYDVKGSLKKHFHDDYSVTIIRNGQCSSWIEGKIYDLTTGNVLLVAPHVVHSCISEPGCSFSVKNISLDSNWVFEFFQDSGLYKRFAERPFVISDSRGMDPFPEAMPGEHHIFEYYISEYFHSLSPGMPEGGRSTDSNAFKAVTAYLRDNYEEEITLDDLSSVSGLSKYHLIRKFREQYNLTPYAYLLNIRINAAKSLLKTDRSLSDIAFDLCFYDQSHFTNSFFRHVGLSPQAYRNISC